MCLIGAPKTNRFRSVVPRRHIYRGNIYFLIREITKYGQVLKLLTTDPTRAMQGSDDQQPPLATRRAMTTAYLHCLPADGLPRPAPHHQKPAAVVTVGYPLMVVYTNSGKYNLCAYAYRCSNMRLRSRGAVFLKLGYRYNP
jgi:hypothetical protein